jgi:CheY-like chemotaxis protein
MAGDARKLVLVVDDDDGIRETLCELLEEEGYSTVAAANGQEALACLRERIPCLILLDLMMPVMDGWEFHRRLQAQALVPSVPVVVITAAGDRATRSIPDVEVLAKPVRLETLLQLVARHCDT